MEVGKHVPDLAQVLLCVDSVFRSVDLACPDLVRAGYSCCGLVLGGLLKDPPDRH